MTAPDPIIEKVRRWRELDERALTKRLSAEEWFEYQYLDERVHMWRRRIDAQVENAAARLARTVERQQALA